MSAKRKVSAKKLWAQCRDGVHVEHCWCIPATAESYDAMVEQGAQDAPELEGAPAPQAPPLTADGRPLNRVPGKLRKFQ